VLTVYSVACPHGSVLSVFSVYSVARPQGSALSVLSVYSVARPHGSVLSVLSVYSVARPHGPCCSCCPRRVFSVRTVTILSVPDITPSRPPEAPDRYPQGRRVQRRRVERDAVPPQPVGALAMGSELRR
jgi:hypothetical protein